MVWSLLQRQTVLLFQLRDNNKTNPHTLLQIVFRLQFYTVPSHGHTSLYDNNFHQYLLLALVLTVQSLALSERVVYFTSTSLLFSLHPLSLPGFPECIPS